jgi:hypothetical protein
MHNDSTVLNKPLNLAAELLLNKHRDVCPAMRINIRFHFSLELLARKWLCKELRLPAQERISHVVYDIPDVCRICLVQSDCYYAPHCP